MMIKQAYVVPISTDMIDKLMSEFMESEEGQKLFMEWEDAETICRLFVFHRIYMAFRPEADEHEFLAFKNQFMDKFQHNEHFRKYMDDATKNLGELMEAFYTNAFENGAAYALSLNLQKQPLH